MQIFGFTLFRVLTIGTSTGSRAYGELLCYLVVWELYCTFTLIFLYIDGIELPGVITLEKHQHQYGNVESSGRALGVIRYLLLIQGFILFVTIMVLLGYLCFMIGSNFTGRRRIGDLAEQSYQQRFGESVRRNNSVRRVEQIIKKFPFGSILNREGQECPICLETFQDKDSQGNDIFIV